MDPSAGSQVHSWRTTKSHAACEASQAPVGSVSVAVAGSGAEEAGLWTH